MIDRDGVINEDSGEFIKSVERVAADRRQPRGDRGAAPRGLARRRRHQSVRRRPRSLRRGDARQRFTSTCASACARPGGELAGVYYCPHLPEAGCDCRKPRPGMFRALERELGVSVRGAPYIGDRLERRRGRRGRRCAADARADGNRRGDRRLGRRARCSGLRRPLRPRRAACSTRRGNAHVRQWVGSILFTLFLFVSVPIWGTVVLLTAPLPRRFTYAGALRVGRLGALAAARALSARLPRRGPRALAAAQLRRAAEALVGVGDDRAAQDFSARRPGC